MGYKHSYEYNNLFCRIYERCGWNYYSELFAEKLLAWIKRDNICVKSSIDLGCGEGILVNALSEAGISAKGMDISPGMIEAAKEKYPHIPFEVGDMVTYTQDSKYDLVTSIYDAVNHVLNIDDIRKAFSNVYEYMNTGGYLVFDLLSLDDVVNTEPIEIDRCDEGVFVFRTTKHFNGFVTLEVGIRLDGKEYDKDGFEVIEVVKEQVYDPEDIKKLLLGIGYSKVDLVSSFPGDPDKGRLTLVMAKK